MDDDDLYDQFGNYIKPEVWESDSGLDSPTSETDEQPEIPSELTTEENGTDNPLYMHSRYADGTSVSRLEMSAHAVFHELER